MSTLDFIFQHVHIYIYYIYIYVCVCVLYVDMTYNQCVILCICTAQRNILSKSFVMGMLNHRRKFVELDMFHPGSATNKKSAVDRNLM